MPTQEEVLENLETVLVPSVMRSLVKMNLVRVAANTLKVMSPMNITDLTMH